MPNWQQALMIFSDHAPEDVPWMLVGSAATRVHGVCLEPADIDILVHPDTSDEAVLRLVDALSGYAADGPGLQTLEEDFLSTHDQAMLAKGNWFFGRWMVDGCKVEVARIREPVDPLLLLETQGLLVWAVREVVEWRGRRLPVVPLEVQVATIVLRGQTAREMSARGAMKERGFNQELLDRAMVARGLR
ncbi:MAG: hypothetical protein ABIS84_15130 [Arachnia sp.]